MTAFMGSAINVALPVMGKEFNAGSVLLSWFATAYLLTTAILLIPSGKLSDIYGRALFMKIGMIIFTIGTFLCGLSKSGEQLIVFRLLQGIGSAFMFVTVTAILVSIFPFSERGKVLGINIGSVYVGLSSGPFIGGLIVHNFGWRYIFFGTFGLGIIIIIFLFIYLKAEWKESETDKFDIKGSLIYVLSLTLVMLGFTFLPKYYGFLLLGSGIIILILFYFFERKLQYPVINVNIFKTSRTFTFSNLSALINYSATSAVAFLMSIYLQNVKGYSAQDAGIILVSQPIIMAVFSPLAGRLSDRIEPRKLASAGMILTTIGTIILAMLNENTELYLIIINLVILGFGFALFSSPNTHAIMSSVEKNYYGTASSVLASMRLVGQLLSMGVVIVIFSVLIGGREITINNQSQFITSMHIAFTIFSILSFFGIFASLARGKIHNN